MTPLVEPGARLRGGPGPQPRVPAGDQHDRPRQRRHEAEHAVHDGDRETGARTEPGGAERPGGDALARAPAADVQRRAHGLENELNGLYTYDRRETKVDPGQVRRIN
ncbi:hypothetical protein AB0L81_20935, partial [Streptomyces sp. NPDC052127]